MLQAVEAVDPTATVYQNQLHLFTLLQVSQLFVRWAGDMAWKLCTVRCFTVIQMTYLM